MSCLPGIPIGAGAGGTKTLPAQITDLACVAGDTVIDVSFTGVPATSEAVLKDYVVVYKQGGIPQSPNDGQRVVLEKISGGGVLYSTTLTMCANDVQYGVRVYPRGLTGQYQTAAEGATALCTPKNSIPLSGFNLGTLVNISRLNAKCLHILVHKTSDLAYLCAKEPVEQRAYDPGRRREWKTAQIRTYANGDFLNGYDRKDLIVDVTNTTCNSGYDGFPTKTYTTVDKVSLLSQIQVGLGGETEGFPLDYFISDSRRQCSSDYWLRGYPNGMYGVDAINTSGTLYAPAYGTEIIGFRPLICMRLTTLFESVPDSDGSYKLAP